MPDFNALLQTSFKLTHNQSFIDISNAVNLTLPSDLTDTTITVSMGGYVAISVKNATENTLLRLYIDGVRMSSVFSINVNDILCCFAPVKKGSSVRFYSNHASPVIAAQNIPLIGAS